MEKWIVYVGLVLLLVSGGTSAMENVTNGTENAGNTTDGTFYDIDLEQIEGEIENILPEIIHEYWAVILVVVGLIVLWKVVF